VEIFGVCVARNEWPMLAVTITHALLNGCDQVLLIDNGSTDDTLRGLEVLRDGEFSDRIHVVSYKGVYKQAAITGAAMQLARRMGANYLLPFDADEFLVTRQNITLLKFIAESLAGLSGEQSIDSYQIAHVHYAVQHDFNSESLIDYANIFAKNLPHQKQIHLTREELAQMVEKREVGFFNNHFWNFKQVVQARKDLFVTAGSHRTLRNSNVFYVPSSEIFLAHLAYPSRKKIENLVSRPRSSVHEHVMDHVLQTSTFEDVWARLTLDSRQQNSEMDFFIDQDFHRTFEKVIPKLQPVWQSLLRPSTQGLTPTKGEQKLNLESGFAALVDLVDLYLGKDYSDQGLG
jgi:Glycosyl transferase family 2